MMCLDFEWIGGVSNCAAVLYKSNIFIDQFRDEEARSKIEVFG